MPDFNAQYQQVPPPRHDVGDWVIVDRGGVPSPAEILRFEDHGAVVGFSDGRERFVTRWSTPVSHSDGG